MYYITSIGYNVLFEELEQTWCTTGKESRWAQPWFERAFSVVNFETELDALIFLRGMYPDQLLTVWEDTGKVVSTHGHESGMTTMVIRKEGRDL